MAKEEKIRNFKVASDCKVLVDSINNQNFQKGAEVTLILKGIDYFTKPLDFPLIELVH